VYNQSVLQGAITKVTVAIFCQLFVYYCYVFPETKSPCRCKYREMGKKSTQTNI